MQGGRITVSARTQAAELVLSVHDTGAGLQAARSPVAGSGFGLTQVRERLATLHGDKAGLTLATAPDGGTLATIRLPLPSPANPSETA